VRFLLDTNTCIAYLAGRAPRLEEHLRHALTRDVVLCSIVKAELLLGAHKSARAPKNLARLAIFFRHFISLPFDDLAAESAGSARAALEIAGTPIGPNDLLIASIALAHDLIVVTHNTGEFSRVRGLRVEDWLA
jgi:tRNA(fMet)-specific endonuclease VapC